MEDHNEENFRKLLRRTAIDKPRVDFTENVMKKVSAEWQHITATEDAALKMLVKSTSLEKPSAAFTDQVLRALPAPSPAIRYQPIIPKKAWYWIAATVSMVIAACFYFPGSTSEQTPKVISFIEKTTSSTHIISDKMANVPQHYSLIIIGLAALMLFDYFLRLKETKLAKS
ncbi:hypothetical protein [Dyadobacter pollutisoli]|uniref:Uncharacterized protein n=1 Tax=Dyadobacter pollutisoli TaxID=2910158 RepID=A0A9E8N7C8_9BACT|nr:hypothetical protein [Dyadobacter pollutisoli]WAC09906.1 hypothetical protein ON006_19355 [Dyadobacter pollutisoli]